MPTSGIRIWIPSVSTNFRSSKTSRPPPMSWISTFRVEVSRTPKAPKSFFVGIFFPKLGGSGDISLYLRSCRSRKHRTPKTRFWILYMATEKKLMQVQFLEMASISSKTKGLWSVDSFYCNTSHPQKISIFSCSWYFWNIHELFCVKEGHRWRCFFWNTSKHWGLWNLMFFDSLRIKDAVWGWGSRQLGHSMKQDLHEPFVSTTKTLGILEFWTFFFVWSIKIPTFWLKLSKQDRCPMRFSMFFLLSKPWWHRHRDEHRIFRRFFMQGWDPMKVLIGSDHKIMGIYECPSPMLGIFVRDNDGLPHLLMRPYFLEGWHFSGGFGGC